MKISALPILFSTVFGCQAQESEQAYQALITPGCVDAAKAGLGPLRGLDASMIPGEGVFLLSGDLLWKWVPQAAGGRFLTRRPSPATTSIDPSIPPVRFRQETFWRSHDRDIQRWHGNGGGWATVLRAPTDFADFEVTSTGQILLIGTPDHLMEAYDPQEEKAVKRLPYPDAGLPLPAVKKRFPFYWDFFRTASVDTFVAIYAAGSGRMFLYDDIRMGLKELNTPWQPVDLSKPEQFLSGPVANISGHPGVGCLQFIPIDGQSLHVAYQAFKVDVDLTWANGKLAGFKKRPSTDAGRNTTHVFEIRLESGGTGPSEPREDLRLPVWRLPSGSLVPLADLLRLPAPGTKGTTPRGATNASK